MNIDQQKSTEISTSHRPGARRRRAPGILAALPETLPFYPYDPSLSTRANGGRRRNRRKDNLKDNEVKNTGDDEGGGGDSESNMIPNFPLHLTIDNGSSGNAKTAEFNDRDRGEFTLFFFIDATNRQSLLALPIVSQWFHYALTGGNKDDEGSEKSRCGRNRVICTPNHPGSERESKSGQKTLPLLFGTGFYHLSFHHSSRIPLLNLLGATRVPSIIVVRNDTGRIVSRYGWEAIEREGCNGGEFSIWLEKSLEKEKLNYVNTKKYDGQNNDNDESSQLYSYESHVVSEWRKGKNGLPLWWNILSWIM